MGIDSIKLTENQFFNVMAETVAKIFCDGFNDYDSLVKEHYECISLRDKDLSNKDIFEQEWDILYVINGCPKLCLTSQVVYDEMDDYIFYDSFEESFVWCSETFLVNYDFDVYRNLEMFYDYLIEKGYIDEYFLGFYHNDKYKIIL